MILLFFLFSAFENKYGDFYFYSSGLNSLSGSIMNNPAYTGKERIIISYKIPFYYLEELDIPGYYSPRFDSTVIELKLPKENFNINAGYSMFSGGLYEERILAAGFSNRIYTSFLEKDESLNFGILFKSLNYRVKYEGFGGAGGFDVDSGIFYSIHNLNFLFSARNILQANIGIVEEYRLKSEFVFSGYYKIGSFIAGIDLPARPAFAFGYMDKITLIAGFSKDSLSFGFKVKKGFSIGFGADIFYSGFNGYFFALHI